MATTTSNHDIPSVQPRPPSIACLGRHLLTLEQRHGALDDTIADLIQARDRGESVYPELLVLEHGGEVLLRAIEACRTLLLCSAPNSPAECALVLVAAIAELNLEGDEPTKETAPRIARVVDALDAVAAAMQGELPADLEPLMGTYVKPSSVRAAAGERRA